MTARTRKTILFVSCLIAVFAATALFVWLVISSDWFKGRLEGSLGESLNMEVSIQQPLRFGLRPGARIVLKDVEAVRDGQVIASVEKISLRLAFPALLLGNLEPRELALERPQLWIERDESGSMNIGDADSEPAQMKALSLPILSISDARLNYLDQISEQEWTAEDCSVTLRDIQHAGGLAGHVISSLSTEGDLTCQMLRHNQLIASDVSAEFVANNSLLVLKPVSAIVFDGQFSGRLELDISSTLPVYVLESSLAGFEISGFMEEVDATGKMNLELLLRGSASNWQEARSSASGTVDLRARDLSIDGFDLDEELANYAATQRFSLVDIGAVVLAGPAGLAVTRGHRFANLLFGNGGGSTQINKVVSEWTVDGGVARAHDVAFSTPRNRIALVGGLDFAEYRFEELQVAVIDRDGCAVIDQRISGSFREPSIKKPNIISTVMGPLTDLVNRGRRAVTDTACTTFYSGSVTHPE